MDAERDPPVNLITCDRAVLVTVAGQPALATTVAAWRQLVADLRTGRWDRGR